MDDQRNNRITVDPAVMVGKPVIKGTRITVEQIMRQLAQGLTVEDILQNYPHLTREDVKAALAYAVEVVAEEVVYPLAPQTHVKTSTLA